MLQSSITYYLVSFKFKFVYIKFKEIILHFGDCTKSKSICESFFLHFSSKCALCCTLTDDWVDSFAVYRTGTIQWPKKWCHFDCWQCELSNKVAARFGPPYSSCRICCKLVSRDRNSNATPINAATPPLSCSCRHSLLQQTPIIINIRQQYRMPDIHSSLLHTDTPDKFRCISPNGKYAILVTYD